MMVNTKNSETKQQKKKKKKKRRNLRGTSKGRKELKKDIRHKGNLVGNLGLIISFKHTLSLLAKIFVIYNPP